MGRIACSVCGKDFCGRSDAIYCSPACRQKAHRVRAARRIDALRGHLLTRSVPVPDHPDATALQRSVADSLRRAREQVSRSRELCRAAGERLQHSAALQQQFGRRSIGPQAAASPRAADPGDRQWPGN